MINFKWLLPSLVMQTLILGGCAVTVKKAELTPSHVVTYESTGKTIYVSPVTIRPQPKPGFLMNEPPRLDGETFRNAISETLQRTGLFSEISKNDNADYILTADVVGQRVLGGASNIGLLLVHYSLVETGNNRKIWRENIFSHYETTAEKVFYGGERVRRLLEALTRDNLSKLGKAIGNSLTSSGL